MFEHMQLSTNSRQAEGLPRPKIPNVGGMSMLLAFLQIAGEINALNS